MEWTKLDSYDYQLFPGVISIKLMGTNDPDLVDIMSEIHRSNGKIYVEGNRYMYDDKYEILGRGRDSFLDLYVTQLR